MADFLANIAHANRMMWLGFASMALGLAAIASPFIAGKAAVIVLGLILLAVGLGQLFARGEVGRSRLWNAIQGAISALSGILVVAHPLLGLGFLTVLLMIYFAADGIWKMIDALQYASVPGWLWLLASGAVSLLLGLLIWKQWPVSETWAVGVLIGANLLSTGIALVAFAHSLKSSFRKVLS
jgi:membrane protein HdeD